MSNIRKSRKKKIGKKTPVDGGFVQVSFGEGPLRMNERLKTPGGGFILDQSEATKKMFYEAHKRASVKNPQLLDDIDMDGSFSSQKLSRSLPKENYFNKIFPKKASKMKVKTKKKRINFLKCQRETVLTTGTFFPAYVDGSMTPVTDSPKKVKVKNDNERPIVKKTYSNKAYYVGQIDKQGKKHGKGKMHYANGDIYDGFFVNDKREGTCNCTFASHRSISFFCSSFKNDKPLVDYSTTILYKNGDKYIGTIGMIRMDKDEQHYGSKLESFVREGQGEMYWKSRGERYKGNWSGDKKEGFGINVITQGEYTEYYGGIGIECYKDGSVYEGNWKDGKKNGKGKLKLSSGDIIDGSFKDNHIKNARFIKGNIEDAPTCSLLLLAESIKAKADESFAHLDFVSFPDNKQVGKKFNIFFKLKEDIIKKEKKKMSQSSLHNFVKSEKEFIIKKRSNDNFHPMYHKSAVTSIQSYLDTSGKQGFLHNVVLDFQNYFAFRYSFIDQQKAVRHHPCALDDIFSFVSALFHKVLEIMGESAQVYGLKGLLSYLKKYVFSKIHKILFEYIYKFKYVEEDSKIQFKLKSLKNVTMQELGIKKRYIPKNVLFKDPYYRVFEIFHTLSQKNNAKDKFDVLSKAHIELITAMDTVEKENSEVPQSPLVPKNFQNIKGADDTFPIYLYTFIKANIPNVFSEFRYMLDCSDKFVQNSELSYRFCTFENAINYISMLDNKVRDDQNVLITPSVIYQKISYKIETIQKNRKKKDLLPLKFEWLSNALLKFGNLYKLEKNLMVDFSEFFSDIYNCFKEMKTILGILGIELKKVKRVIPKDLVITNKRASFWTNLDQKRRDGEVRNSEFTFNVIILHVYPSFVYTQIARKLELL